MNFLKNNNKLHIKTILNFYKFFGILALLFVFFISSKLMAAEKKQINKMGPLLTIPYILQEQEQKNTNQLQKKKLLTLPFYDTDITNPIKKTNKNDIYWEYKKPSSKPKYKVKNKFINQPKNTVNKINIKKAPLLPVKKVELPVPELPPTSILETFDNKNIKKDEILNNIIFERNSTDITPNIEDKLQKLIKKLNNNPNLRVQLHAFATGIDGNLSSARRISLSRALAIREYLKSAGIRTTRIDVMALGDNTDKQPIDRVDFIFIK